jgi:hypothetical protein
MPSAWVEHVRAYAAKNKVSYKEAMTAAKATYQKGEKKSPASPKGSPKAERKATPKPKAEKKEKSEEAAPKKMREKKGSELKEMKQGEAHDDKAKAHTQKKRETAASALKPRKMAQIG